MIFQGGIDLDIKDRKVQAILDMDTGMIGFTELVGDKQVEYFYTKAPVEFRLAFIRKMETQFSPKCLLNFPISHKSEFSKKMMGLVQEES